MKTLLRSTFIYAKDDDPALFLRNYLMLTEAELGFDTAADISIWEYIQQFVQRHNHVPEYATLTLNFSLTKQVEALDRLETVAKLPAITQGDFESRVENKAAERRTRRAGEVLKEAHTILQTGMEVPDGKQKKTMFGPIDAMRYVLDRSTDIVAPTLGANLSGEATRDGENVRKEYELVEMDPLAGIGQYTGLPQMDVVLGGAKRHELWVHAAYTGGLKSTFALNWAYKQAIYFRHSSTMFSLEMPYKQCRRILYALHSAHEKFRPVRHQLGLQQDPQATVGLNYGDIRDGKLTAEAKKFLFEYVIPDYKDETNKYGRIHIEVSDPDKSDFTVADLRQRAELIYSNAPYSMLIVDHAGLMAPRKWVSNTTERLNEVIRDLKRLAMSFNRGQGMGVVTLFQVGREGYKRVKKSREGGVRAEYNPTDLSYANEAERSADIITATWIDKTLREQNRVEFQCLKSRDQAPFETFLARVEWPCRAIIPCWDMPVTPTASGASSKKQAEIDAAADALSE